MCACVFIHLMSKAHPSPSAVTLASCMSAPLSWRTTALKEPPRCSNWTFQRPVSQYFKWGHLELVKICLAAFPWYGQSRKIRNVFLFIQVTNGVRNGSFPSSFWIKWRMGKNQKWGSKRLIRSSEWIGARYRIVCWSRCSWRAKRGEWREEVKENSDARGELFTGKGCDNTSSSTTLHDHKSPSMTVLQLESKSPSGCAYYLNRRT